jgi:hypothetical protein
MIVPAPRSLGERVLSSSTLIAGVALVTTPFLLVLGVWLSAFMGRVAAIIGASTTGYAARIRPLRAGN